MPDESEFDSHEEYEDHCQWISANNAQRLALHSARTVRLKLLKAEVLKRIGVKCLKLTFRASVSEPLNDDVVQHCSTVAEKLKEQLDELETKGQEPSNEVSGLPSMAPVLSAFTEHAQACHFAVIFGGVKAGKTTFLRSLVGVDCLYIDSCPATSLPFALIHDATAERTELNVGATLLKWLQQRFIEKHAADPSRYAKWWQRASFWPNNHKVPANALQPDPPTCITQLGPEETLTVHGDDAIREVSEWIHKATRVILQNTDALPPPLDFCDLPTITCRWRALGNSAVRFCVVDMPGGNELFTPVPGDGESALCSEDHTPADDEKGQRAMFDAWKKIYANAGGVIFCRSCVTVANDSPVMIEQLKRITELEDGANLKPIVFVATQLDRKEPGKPIQETLIHKIEEEMREYCLPNGVVPNQICCVSAQMSLKALVTDEEDSDDPLEHFQDLCERVEFLDESRIHAVSKSIESVSGDLAVGKMRAPAKRLLAACVRLDGFVKDKYNAIIAPDAALQQSPEHLKKVNEAISDAFRENHLKKAEVKKLFGDHVSIISEELKSSLSECQEFPAVQELAAEAKTSIPDGFRSVRKDATERLCEVLDAAAAAVNKVFSQEKNTDVRSCVQGIRDAVSDAREGFMRDALVVDVKAAVEMRNIFVRIIKLIIYGIDRMLGPSLGAPQTALSALRCVNLESSKVATGNRLREAINDYQKKVVKELLEHFDGYILVIRKRCRDLHRVISATIEQRRQVHRSDTDVFLSFAPAALTAVELSTKLKVILGIKEAPKVLFEHRDSIQCMVTSVQKKRAEAPPRFLGSDELVPKVQQLFDKCIDPAKMGAGRDMKYGKDEGQQPYNALEVVSVHQPADADRLHKKYRENKSHAAGVRPGHFNAALNPKMTDVACEVGLVEQKSLDESKNEHFVVTGTSAWGDIALDGFDERWSSNAMLGRAVYFAGDLICKADQYTVPEEDGVHTVLLCRALLGNIHEVTKEEQAARVLNKLTLPHQAPRAPACTNTLLGGNQYREYAVFDGNLVYPEFIVRYRRVMREK